jgi:WD40 repeat protein
MNAKSCRVLFLALATILTLTKLASPLFAQQNPVATLLGHSGNVRTVAFSPDGKLLASGSTDNSIRVWDVDSHVEKAVLKNHSETVSSVAFSPDGKYLASGSYDSSITLWDVASLREIATLGKGTNSSPAYRIAFSPDGRTLAASGSSGANFWNVAKRALLPDKTEQCTGAFGLAFTPDGKVLAKCGSHEAACLDLATGKELIIGSRPTSETTSCVAVSSNNRTLAIGGRKHTVTLWDITTGVKQSTWKSHVELKPPAGINGCGIPIDGLVYSVAFSPDGEILAMASYDCAVKLWHVKTGKRLESLTGHDDFVWSVAFSPDNKLIATGGEDNTVRIWNVPARR